MKLIDKIKDLFMDEITEEDEEEELLEKEVKKTKKESTKDVLPKVMRETIRKEEKKEIKIEPNELVNEEKKVVQKESSVKKNDYIFDFEADFPSRNKRINNDINVSNDFDINKEVKLDNIREDKAANFNFNSNSNVLNIDREVTKKVTELYPNKETVKEKPKFKASPVISPVYGVLDKNYKKDEVKERDDEVSLMKRPSKKVDFETVRKKAFGNLADEIKDNLLCENCELYKEVKKISSLKEDDLLYDMTVDEEKEVTIEKAYDNYEEFGVAYEPKIVNKMALEEETEEEKEDIVINKEKQDDDSLYDEVIAKKDKMPQINEKETKTDVVAELHEEDVPSRESISKSKDTKVDADFFELIDSMYKERTDD